MHVYMCQSELVLSSSGAQMSAHVRMHVGCTVHVHVDVDADVYVYLYMHIYMYM